MATNLKGQGGIKGILLLHGEKIAIALVSAMALWFVYSSMKLPRLNDNFQAAKLQSEITTTSSQIKEFSWDTSVKEHPDKVKLAVPIAAKNDLTVKPDDYVNSTVSGKPDIGLDRPVVAPMIRRTDPTLVNAVDVKAYGGSGLLAFIDEKIKAAQDVKRRTEEAARAKKEEEKRKKDQQKPPQGQGPGQRPGARTREAPGGPIANEVIDPDHPKRRMVQSSARTTGIPLQGGERIERAYWACVVAKVPIREQLKLYQDAFEKARGYDEARDFPHYVGYLVDRAEVLPGQPLNWKRVPLYDGQRQSILSNQPIDQSVNFKMSVPRLYELAAQFWAGMSQEVVDQHYTDFVLTLPLPPLVGRDWGADATHPDIPLLGPDTPVFEDQVQQPIAAQAPAQPTNTDENAGFSSLSGQNQPGPGGPGFATPPRAPGMGPGMPSNNFRRPSSEGPGRGMYGPESTGRFLSQGAESRPSYGGTGSSAAPGQRTSLPKGLDFLLLRFFDYTVEPGKKYKYRVKLVLADPNMGMQAAVLANDVLNRHAKEAQAAKARNAQRPDFRLLETWSEPSPTVGIPLAGSVRLADVKVPAAEKFNDEPTVKLLVESFDVDNGGNAIQAAFEKDFHRGAVANITEDADYLVEGGTQIDTQPGFKFHTGMTLLDVDGGAKLTRDMTAPTRILVMGPAGELYVRNELDDKPGVEYHRLLFEKPNDKRRGPNIGPGGPEATQGGPGRPRPGGREH